MSNTRPLLESELWRLNDVRLIISTARSGLNMTIKEIAQQAHMPPEKLSKIEKGLISIPAEKIDAIAGALDINAEKLRVASRTQKLSSGIS